MYMDMRIVRGMNIYITKDNEKFLKNLKPDESMSGVINKLLNDYRKGRDYDIFPLSPLEQNKPELVLSDISPPLPPPVAKNSIRASNGLCKVHGLPLDARGRCLQKGCKYA